MLSGLFKNLIPDEAAPSAAEVDYGRLLEEGVKGVIFDIDNTLVMHGAPADARCVRLIGSVRDMGLTPFILSNNERARVESFANAVGAGYIFKAGKPSKDGYLKACGEMGLSPDNAAAVGDQIFTDIWGAKRSGVRAILVSPIDPREELQIKIKRLLERPILVFFVKSASGGPRGGKA